MPPPRMRTGAALPITNDGTVPMDDTLFLGGHRIRKVGAPIEPDDVARLADVGGSGLGDFVFSDFGTQDPIQGRYTSWPALMAKLATLQLGASPVIRFALASGPFTVPLTDMPVTGWDIRGGSFTSFYGATGAVVVDCPPGVMFDNLFRIGGSSLGDGAVVVKIAPPAGTHVLNFSALPPGGAHIFVIGGGSAIDHSTDVGALMKGPNDGTTMVLVSAGSQQNTGIVPPLTGPLLELGANDGAVGGQLVTGGLPDGWLAGGRSDLRVDQHLRHEREREHARHRHLGARLHGRRRDGSHHLQQGVAAPVRACEQRRLGRRPGDFCGSPGQDRSSRRRAARRSDSMKGVPS